MILFTMPVNPYTATFLYPFQCWMGAKLLGQNIRMKVIHADFAKFFSDPSWMALRDLSSDVLIPMLLGGLIFGVITAVFGYFSSLGMVQRYRKRKEMALRKRLSFSSKREKTVCITLDKL